MLVTTAVNGGARGTAATVDILVTTAVNGGARGTAATGDILVTTAVNGGARGTAAIGDILVTVVNGGICRRITGAQSHRRTLSTALQCLIFIIRRQSRSRWQKQACNQPRQCGTPDLPGTTTAFTGQFRGNNPHPGGFIPDSVINLVHCSFLL